MPFYYRTFTKKKPHTCIYCLHETECTTEYTCCTCIDCTCRDCKCFCICGYFFCLPWCK